MSAATPRAISVGMEHPIRAWIEAEKSRGRMITQSALCDRLNAAGGAINTQVMSDVLRFRKKLNARTQLALVATTAGAVTLEDLVSWEAELERSRRARVA